MTFPSFTFPVAPPPDNYKSILYTQKQVKEFEKTKSKSQRAYSFHLHYNSFCFFDITSHMIYWPESQESQKAKDYAFFCFYNKLYLAEEIINEHKFFTMTKHCFDHPFLIEGLLVNQELFFFSRIERVGTCQIHFDQDARSLLSHGFSYKEGNIPDFRSGLGQKIELNTIDKIKEALGNYFSLANK